MKKTMRTTIEIDTKRTRAHIKERVERIDDEISRLKHSKRELEHILESSDLVEQMIKTFR